ncbi:MAG: DNA topoisomerase, partial [Saprospiraceae bacterium]
DELRDLMKENGIGRPSTRAAIIETLFRRKYIERKRKNILPTETGVKLIDTINNPMLKSAELTGQWEKQLRDIENGEYSPKTFIDNMKGMVSQLVDEVRMAKSVKIFSDEKPDTKFAKKKKPVTKNKIEGATCPKCQQGKLLKGKSAYGCSRWKDGCKFLLPFKFMDKKIPEKQLSRLVAQGSTIQIRGFKKEGKKVNGNLKFNDNFELFLKEKEPRKVGSQQIKTASVKKNNDSMLCPKCGVGNVVKGKTAYGCSTWQNGCTWRFSFDEVRKKTTGKTVTKQLVEQILRGGLL